MSILAEADENIDLESSLSARDTCGLIGILWDPVISVRHLGNDPLRSRRTKRDASSRSQDCDDSSDREWRKRQP